MLGDCLKYRVTNSPWGLSALYEGYSLEFSAVSSRARIRRERLFQLLPSLAPSTGTAPTTIIQTVDLYSLFSPSAKRAWNQACASALRHKRELSLEDVFLSLLTNAPSVKKLFKKVKINTTDAEKFLKNYLRLSHQPETGKIKQLPFEAFAMAMKLHNRKIGGLMLLGGLLRLAPEDSILQAIFSNIGLTLEKLEVLSVWILNLDYEFPKNSRAAQMLYCCRQAQSLEQHFGYFYEFPAIEQAVRSSTGYYRDLRGQKALQYLVKAGRLAKSKGQKIIGEKLVLQAAK